MKFHLSEEQELMQASFRRALQDVCPPERRRKLLDAGSDFDSATWNAMMQLGLGGLMIPEPYGGSGLGVLDGALAAEILGEAAAPGPFFGHVLAGYALGLCADSALKERWLPKLASGEARAAVVFDETWLPEASRISGEGGVVNGEARFVPGADAADLFLVVAKDGALFAVERSQTVQIAKLNSSDRTRRISAVTFRDAPAIVLGGEDLSRALFDAGLVLLAADALGGAQQCLSMSVDYAQMRRQFDVPIAQFQAVKHQLADMAVELEPSRALVWYAGHHIDKAAPDASRTASMAKAHLADRFVSVARAAVLVHGGIGYTWEYDLQIWFRRSLFDRAYLGAPSLHRERAAALAGW